MDGSVIRDSELRGTTNYHRLESKRNVLKLVENSQVQAMAHGWMKWILTSNSFSRVG